MKKAILIILLAVAGCYSKMDAQQAAVMISDKTGWHKIGETTVSFAKDTDEVVVVGADKFASIKFRITEAPIILMDFDVYYESGDKQHITNSNKIKSPGESKVFDLNGGERRLKKIRFVYKTVPNSKDTRAHVEIWGLKTNEDKK